VSNLYFISQLLFRRYGGNILVQLLGRWSADEFNGQMSPVGGLVYYISPPDSLAAAAANPVHTLFYVAFMLGSEWLASQLASQQWQPVSQRRE
jgi:protein transport protein SEC61 subunit alpha